jgi:hypothetical protein
MTMAPERPTPIRPFLAWCITITGALVVIETLAEYGLRRGWTHAAMGFFVFAMGLWHIDRSRRAKRGAPADASRREIVNGEP